MCNVQSEFTSCLLIYTTHLQYLAFIFLFFDSQAGFFSLFVCLLVLLLTLVGRWERVYFVYEWMDTHLHVLYMAAASGRWCSGVTPCMPKLLSWHFDAYPPSSETALMCFGVNVQKLEMRPPTHKAHTT